MARRERVPYKTRALWEDKEAWRILKKEYLEANDPTEYLFATTSKILDGGKTGDKWLHWQFICKSTYCKGDVIRWRKELEVKMQAEAIRDIYLNSKGEKGFQAQKFIVERGWDKKRGRPSKADIKHATEIEKAALSEVDELFQSAGEPNAKRLN